MTGCPIHGLKAIFDLVLKNLDHVRGAATTINRAFSKVQVSNLKAVKLEVVEQSDLVSQIKCMAAFEPGGLFDANPQQESAIANFRRKIQDTPVIHFADLFTLAFTVTGADDQRHTYHNFRQIESHGTTTTIKVLFNLLLLKDQLRRDDCALPFYLDDIENLIRLTGTPFCTPRGNSASSPSPLRLNPSAKWTPSISSSHNEGGFFCVANIAPPSNAHLPPTTNEAPSPSSNQAA